MIFTTNRNKFYVGSSWKKECVSKIGPISVTGNLSESSTKITACGITHTNRFVNLNDFDIDFMLDDWVYTWSKTGTFRELKLAHPYLL